MTETLSSAVPPHADVHLAKMIATALKNARLPLSTEKVTQQHLADVFTSLGIFHAREFRLGDGDILDFFVQGADGKGAALEVKMRKARPAEVLRQLARYAKHDLITCLVLISNRAIDVPERLNDKPVYFISLGRAWL